MPRLRHRTKNLAAQSGELELVGRFTPGLINTVTWDIVRRTVVSLQAFDHSMVVWGTEEKPPVSILFDTGLSTARPGASVTIETVISSRTLIQRRGLRGGRVQVPPGQTSLIVDIPNDQHGHLGVNVFWPTITAWIIEGWHDSSIYDQWGRNRFNIVPGLTQQIPPRVREIILFIPDHAPPIMALFQFGRGVNSLWNGTFTFTGEPARFAVPDAASYFLISGVNTDLVTYQFVY